VNIRKKENYASKKLLKERKRKRKSYAHRIHPRRELRKVVSLAKNPHHYPQSESNWGPLRTSPPSGS